MVILIGGASCIGKTLMAQRLLERYKIPYLSLDHLKMGLYRADESCGFTPEGNADLIEEKLWPIVRGIIMTVIENRQSLVIEGCYLYPQRLRELGPEYTARIIPVFMGFSAEYVRENYHCGIIGHRSEIELREYAEERTAEQMIVEQEFWKTMCESEGARYFELDGDYENATARIYEWIDRAASGIRKG